MTWEGSPASPYASDWALGAELGALGVIYVGEIPTTDVPALLEQGWQWNFGFGPQDIPLGGPEDTAPPTDFDVPPVLPQEPPPVQPPAPIEGEIVGELPRAATPEQPVGVVPDILLPPEGDYSDEAARAARDTEIRRNAPPPNVDAQEGEILINTLPRIIGAIGRIVLGPAGNVIGPILEPTPLDSGDAVGLPPQVNIPPPQVSLPEPTLPPPPAPEVPQLTMPTPPDVVVVTPETPPFTPPLPQGFPAPSQAPGAFQILGPIIGGVLVNIHRRRRARTPSTTRLPSPTSPPTPLPLTPPSIAEPALPLPIASPLPLPTASPLPSPAALGNAPPLTPVEAPPVESASCETPQERKERQKRQRENCGKKLVRIKVKAHYRKVCLSEAIEHEAKRYKKKLVRKYITKPVGKLAQEGTDWLLEHVGLTPYAKQAKETKKRVVELTKKSKPVRIEIPGTHADINLQDFLPKPLGGKL